MNHFCLGWKLVFVVAKCITICATIQLLYRKYSGNFFVNLLGKWKESEYSGGQFVPVGGLAYYVTAPAR